MVFKLFIGGIAMIDVKDLTLKYSNGKGIENVEFVVGQGEVMGYLGPNGAGKTTTIRCLLGFTKPDSGQLSINGLDCIKQSAQVHKILGYLPGEIAFPGGMKGTEFLKLMCDMRGLRDTTRQKQLIDMFELEPNGSIKKFSKGMKQKIGIVAAFMHSPEIIILDEPTSGLDPLMQNRFVELIIEEKKKGKTILMSSHMFEEIERTCDNVAIIKDGILVTKSDIESLKNKQRKAYIVRLSDMEDANKIKAQGYDVVNIFEGGVEVFVKGDSVADFISFIGSLSLTGLDIKAQTLESIFLHYYGQEVKGV